MYYFHLVIERGTVFTHFFYIPIILASLWWKRKGLVVAIFLAAILIASHIFIRLGVETVNDYLRAFMFIVVAFVVATLSGQIAKAEKALHRASAYNRSLIEASLDPLVTIDPEGKITDVNTATEVITGCSREELIGTDFSDYFTDPEKARAGYQQVFQEGVVQDYALEIRSRDGDITPVLYNASVYRDEAGNVIGVFAAARDITERRQAEQELARSNAELQSANKELETFSYSVSHDLRAPLRSVDGFSQILLEDYSDALDEQGKHYLQRARASTQKMGQLIDDILNLSRIGRQAMKKKKINMVSIARETYNSLEDEWKGRKVDFNVHKCPPAAADLNLIKIVFMNLLSNALKFTGNRKEAKIEVGSETKDEQTVFFVKDNGVGFDMKYADKLFAPFQRLHRPEEYEGTGIGLANVQRIIHRHGGRIWVESKVGKGTTFYFTV